MANKRLLRSIEDKFLGGICGGIAQYFGFEHTWVIRLLFLVSAFWFGSSIWIYLILWVILPKQKIADLLAEKKALAAEKGEIIEEEPITGFVKKLYFLVWSIVRGILRFISRFSGIILLVFTVFATMLFFSSFNFSFGDTFQINGGVQSLGFQRIIAFIIPPSFNLNLLYYSVVSAVVIPLLYLFFVSLILMRHKIKIHILIHGVIVLFFVINVIFLSTQVRQLKQEFATKTEKTQPITIPSNGELWYLTPLNSNQNIGDIHFKFEHNAKGVMVADSGIFLKNITIVIERSKGNMPEMLYSVSAYGKTEAEANQNQNTVLYNFSQENNQLHFPNYFKIPLNQLWRNQAVKIVLRFPVNSKIKFDVFMDEFEVQINDPSQEMKIVPMGGKIVEINEKSIATIDELQQN